MKREVVVYTLGKSRDSSEEKWDALDITTTGYIYEKNHMIYLIYDEYMGESPEDLVHSRIKIDQYPLSVNVTRSGCIHTCFTYMEDYTDVVDYATPYGNFLMKVETRNLKYSYKEDTGAIHLEITYGMSVNGEKLTDHILCIDTKALNEREGGFEVR